MSLRNHFKHRSKGLQGYLDDRSVIPGNRREDSLLRHRIANLSNLHWKDFVGHYGCVNAIEFSHGLGQFIASGGDDRRVLLWNVEKALSDIGKPAIMKGEHNSNIFCMGFNLNNTTIFSGGNDEQVIVHDIATGETKDVFSHEDAVYGLSPDPTSPTVFATACDDGRVLIYDTRDSCADPFCLANYTSSMHSVMYNPVEPRLLATANAKEGVGLWDVRKPKSCLLRYGGNLVQQSCMSVRFNQNGDQIIALRRRLPPVLYKLHSHEPVCEFDHSGYYNSCTMKSICFAGDNDQYVVSGSDEFNLYMWALPDDLSERMYINSAHMVLKGHRSIVNQVRFNPANHLLISSGVEKIIKVWSPFKLPSVNSFVKKISEEEKTRERHVFSHEEYINLVLQDGHVMSHDYSQASTEEDPRMMAFFDSLVQRELDGWSSDDSMSSNEEALFSRIVQLSQSDIDSDDSIPDIGDINNETDPNYSAFTIAFASVMAGQAVEGNDRFPRLNRALENAERGYANISSDDDDTVQSGSNTTVTHPVTTSNGDEPLTNGEDESKNLLSELVKKKKSDIREILKKKMKDLMSSRSTSMNVDNSDSDTSDSDSSSVSSLNLEIGEDEKQDAENDKTETSSQLFKPEQSKTETRQKLKHFNSLRRRLLNNDSDNSELEIHEKVGDSLLQTKDEKEAEGKIKFKKLKRRHVEVSNVDRKEKAKSRESPDLGPFIQKSGMGIEPRRHSNEEGASGKRNPSDSTLSDSRGKHKFVSKTGRHSSEHHKHCKASHCHKHQDGNSEKISRKISEKSKHKHHTESSTGKHEHCRRIVDEDLDRDRCSRRKDRIASKHEDRTRHRLKSESNDQLDFDEQRLRYYNQKHDSKCDNKNHTSEQKQSNHGTVKKHSGSKYCLKDKKYDDLSEDEDDEKGKDCEKIQEKLNKDTKGFENHGGASPSRLGTFIGGHCSSSCDNDDDRNMGKYNSGRKSRVSEKSNSDTAVPSCSYSKSESQASDHKKSRKEKESVYQYRDGHSHSSEGKRKRQSDSYISHSDCSGSHSDHGHSNEHDGHSNRHDCHSNIHDYHSNRHDRHSNRHENHSNRHESHTNRHDNHSNQHDDRSNSLDSHKDENEGYRQSDRNNDHIDKHDGHSHDVENNQHMNSARNDQHKHCVDKQKSTGATNYSSSSEEDQPTWREFKRFKNRLERARKKYMEERHHRKHKDEHHKHE